MNLPNPVLGDHPINLLREAHAALEVATKALPVHQQARITWLMDGMRLYEDRAASGLTLDAALGLCRRSGPAQWHNIERLAKRNRALCAFAAKHYPALCPTGAAEAIHRDLMLLGRQTHPPEGSATADLVLAMRHGAIPGIRGLRNILSAEIKSKN